MLINELIEDLEIDIEKDVETAEISGISVDTRRIEAGELFIALPGHESDGHKYLAEATKAGAAALLIEKNKKSFLPESIDIPVITADSTRAVLVDLLKKFYGNPSEDLILIGVTGTNGKTTTTHLLESILKEQGNKIGLIGTITRRFAGQQWKATRTTPSVVENYRCLREWVDKGCTAAVMEVSSHGLEQGRVEGLSFAAAGFTNLTQDHLDYHENMEQYYRAKRKLFDQSEIKIACSDQQYGQRLVREENAVSVGKTGDYRIEQADSKLTGTSLDLVLPSGDTLSLKSSLTGLFNCRNIALAAALALELKVAPEVVARGVENCANIPGRCERVLDRPAVIVDYAHTADAMENVIGSLRPLVDGNLIVVFGAGGDRDRGKRPQMGRVAEQISDYAVVTSDNPRSEDPDQIIEDITAGMSGNNYEVEPDRGQAIRIAIEKAREDDLVLIVGKGHETEQVIADKIIPFDDVTVAREVAKTIGF